MKPERLTAPVRLPVPVRLLALTLALTGGCVEDNPSVVDDVGAADRAVPTPDGGGDLAVDPRPDATLDATADATLDATPDATADATADAMPDATIDAIDSAPPDATAALDADHPADAMVIADAAPTDAAPTDAALPAFCPGNGGRTSGLAESFAPGAFCDALYICLGAPPTPDFIAAFTAAFPEALCRGGDDCYDFGGGPPACTCGRPAGGFCRVFVRQVDAEEYTAACTLSGAADRPEIVCGGDF